MGYAVHLLTSLALALLNVAGFPNAEMDSASASTGDDLVNLDVTIVDSFGAPIAGVWIAARHGKRETPWPVVPEEEQFLALSQSDEFGCAILTGIPLELFIEVAAWGKGWSLRSRRIEAKVLLSGERLATKFVMEFGRDVQLQVVDFDGDPVADAKVRLRVGQPSIDFDELGGGHWGWSRPVMLGYGYLNGYEQRAKSDENGVLVFAAVPYEVGEFRWFHPGFINCGNEGLNAFTTRAKIRANPGGAVGGKVLLANGEPAVGARIYVHSQMKRPKQIGVGIQGVRNPMIPDELKATVKPEDGRFSITGYPIHCWYYLEIEFHDVLFRTPWRHTDIGDQVFELPPVHIFRGRFLGDSEKWKWVSFDFQAEPELAEPKILPGYGRRFFHVKEDGSFSLLVEEGIRSVRFSFFVDGYIYYHTHFLRCGSNLGEIPFPPLFWPREIPVWKGVIPKCVWY